MTEPPYKNKKRANNYTKLIMQKFLIIRLSSMGDVILTSLLIRCIKKTFPNAKIDFVVDKNFVETIQFNPHLNKIIIYDKTKNITTNNLLKKELTSDYKIIDLQNNLRSICFRRGLGENIVAIPKRRFQKLCLTMLKINLFEKISIPQLYLKTAAKFNIENDGKGLELWLNDETPNNYFPAKKQNIPLHDAIKNNENCVIAIAPAAKHKTKQWIPEYFADLIAKLHQQYAVKFYLLGGKADYEICCLIENIVKQNNVEKCIISNHSGKTSILETAKLIDECSLLITNDTGIMHIGAARQIPIVSIFGSTSPAFGFAPYFGEMPNNMMKICSLDLKCQPCTHIGKKKCPKNHFNCMKLLKSDMVFEKIVELINQ